MSHQGSPRLCVFFLKRNFIRHFKWNQCIFISPYIPICLTLDHCDSLSLSFFFFGGKTLLICTIILKNVIYTAHNWNDTFCYKLYLLWPSLKTQNVQLVDQLEFWILIFIFSHHQFIGSVHFVFHHSCAWLSV